MQVFFKTECHFLPQGPLLLRLFLAGGIPLLFGWGAGYISIVISGMPSIRTILLNHEISGLDFQAIFHLPSQRGHRAIPVPLFSFSPTGLFLKRHTYRTHTDRWVPCAQKVFAGCSWKMKLVPVYPHLEPGATFTWETFYPQSAPHPDPATQGASTHTHTIPSLCSPDSLHCWRVTARESATSAAPGRPLIYTTGYRAISSSCQLEDFFPVISNHLKYLISQK